MNCLLKIRLVLVCILYLYLTGVTYAQSYYFNHYQVEAGLSHNSVLCSIQDKEGFLWFGTKDGLNRFDGYTFKIFRSDASDSGSIGSNFIQTLLEKDGKLWIGTDKGLYIYHKGSERFNLLKVTTNSYIRDFWQLPFVLLPRVYFGFQVPLAQSIIMIRHMILFPAMTYFPSLCLQPADG